MSGSNAHHGIDYVEFTVHDMAAAKEFYSTAFGWRMRDYGPAYAGIRRTDGADDEMGGLALAEDKGKREPNPVASPLVILYSSDIAASFSRVEKAGGTITKEIFAFPGGRRFEFADPSGNVLAVWTKG